MKSQWWKKDKQAPPALESTISKAFSYSKGKGKDFCRLDFTLVDNPKVIKNFVGLLTQAIKDCEVYIEQIEK